jgi:hypothetical protein
MIGELSTLKGCNNFEVGFARPGVGDATIKEYNDFTVQWYENATILTELNTS